MDENENNNQINKNMKELENYLRTIYEAKENGGIIDIRQAVIDVILLSNKVNEEVVLKLINNHERHKNKN